MQTHGHKLTEGQIQQLQWVLPTPFSAEFRAFLSGTDAAGAKLRITVAGAEHWLGVFEIDRMVDEALRFPKTTLTQFPRLLPFAGCGQRRTTLYLVDVLDSSVWLFEPGSEPVCLGVTLDRLWASATTEPRVVVRRRLPAHHVPQRPARKASNAQRPRVEPPCSRTLSLFPA